jgi:hypothetical protein
MKFKKIILLLIALQFFYSVSNAQIKLVGNITTNGIASYPTHIDSLGKGGYMSMPTIADRNAIPTSRRKYGMLVFVQADGVIYKLNAATLANTDWVALALGSSVSADLTGDVTSVGSATTVKQINGTALSGLATGILKNTTATGVPSIAIAADFPTLNQSTSGNATTATNLTGLTTTVATLNNQSGTNTGDNSANSLYSGLVTNATHTGDATGSIDLTVVKINGTLLSALATGILKNTNGTGVPSIAIAADFPTLNQSTSGNAATATNLIGLTTTVATLNNQSGTNTGDQTIVLTGDVTGTGTGTFTSTIANSAVRYAKIQNITAGKLLGSINAGAAAPGEVTIGSGLSLSTGGTLTASGTGGTVTNVNALTLGTSGTDITSTVANGTTTPAITLNIPTASATNRGALSATDFTTFNAKQTALTFGKGLTNSSNTVTVNTSQNIATLSNLTSNGIVTTSGGVGILSVTSILPVANGGTGSGSQNFVDLTTVQTIAGAKTFTASVAGDNSTNPKISGFSVNINPQTNTTYALAASDNGKIITLNNSSPITLSLPVLTAGFNCMIIQTGSGAVTLTGLSTTVSNKNLFNKTAGLNSVVTIIYLTTNTAITIGDMSN